MSDVHCTGSWPSGGLRIRGIRPHSVGEFSGVIREALLAQANAFNTDRLTFRPCCADDLDNLHHLWAHPDIRRFLFDDRAITREEALDFIEASDSAFASRGYGIWLFFEACGNEIAGFAGLLESSEGPPNLVYGTRPGL